MSISATQLLLARLDSVHASGDGWIAKCPAHEDRSPSLSVCEGDDGRALLHCFGGCSAIEVVRAVGFTLADLFPEQKHRNGKQGLEARRAAYKRVVSSAAIGVLAREATVVAMAAAMIERGESLSPDDVKRLHHAALRLQDARGVLR